MRLLENSVTHEYVTYSCGSHYTWVRSAGLKHIVQVSIYSCVFKRQLVLPLKTSDRMGKGGRYANVYLKFPGINVGVDPYFSTLGA